LFDTQVKTFYVITFKKSAIFNNYALKSKRLWMMLHVTIKTIVHVGHIFL